ncbi:hypothetical protein ACFXPS_17525 [Nocardia sp. NPDC059091]|uniref:hypothetical protein n=1 Tax=unclassified Nocardia TaxID=2637762 RepID=UPI0036B2C416
MLHLLDHVRRQADALELHQFHGRAGFTAGNEVGEAFRQPLRDMAGQATQRERRFVEGQAGDARAGGRGPQGEDAAGREAENRCGAADIGDDRVEVLDLRRAGDRE